MTNNDENDVNGSYSSEGSSKRWTDEENVISGSYSREESKKWTNPIEVKMEDIYYIE